MRTTLLAVAALAVGGLARAQEADDAMAGMDHVAIGPDAMGQDGALGEMMTAMDAMMAAMPADSAGTVDADFLVMMIPHHQAAIDMARVELAQGADEEARALAREIIDAQEAEIAEMRAMLEGMGVEAPAATE